MFAPTLATFTPRLQLTRSAPPPSHFSLPLSGFRAIQTGNISRREWARMRLRLCFENEEVDLEDAKEAFKVFDENCDGFIDASELKKVVCSLGFGEISKLECEKMILAFDDNGDGRIDFGEFAKLLENSSW
ncbi:calcium-binding EF-hand family protein [Actinidia rufa]|uniref:Calcium-binding EF-hand family protein n=1 Tax=Actinidia rufa TaxID=165716 RepID=A0A7J0GMX6_9ERIC|nr:calcium-binding EF-hand family protein [Actinidia rufa]